MKRLLLFVTLTFLSASCEVGGDRPSLFYATVEDQAPESKVYADASLHVLWNQDDRISIFNKTDFNGEYVFQGKDGDNAGTFGPVQEGAGNAIEHVYAVYPYDPGTTIDAAGAIAYIFPDVQWYQPASFGTGANAMVSVTDGNNLYFKNIGGYLSFKLYGEGVTVGYISFRGNNHEKLSGPAIVTISPGETPDVVMQSGAGEELILVCDEPVTLKSTPEEYTEFWFVVPPTIFTKGFTVTVTDIVGCHYEKTSSSPLTIERNTISRMAPVQKVPAIDVTNSEGIIHENW